MCVLNVQKLTSWVLWIFMNWPYGYFEYLWGDVIGILNNEVTLWKYLEADVMGILKFIFKITLLNIQNIHDITSRIFKIPMSLWIFKICHIFKIPMTSLQEYYKIPMTSAFEYSHDVTLWIPMTSLHEYSKCLMSNLNIRKLTPWVFWKFMRCYWSFEYSWINNLSIHEVRSTIT